MTRFAMALMLSVGMSVPAIAEEANRMTKLDQNYIQLVDEGWIEVYAVRGGLILKNNSRPTRERVFCNTGPLVKQLTKMQMGGSSGDFTLDCYKIESE